MKIVEKMIDELDDEKMMADFDRWFLTPFAIIAILIMAAVIIGHGLYWMIGGG